MPLKDWLQHAPLTSGRHGLPPESVRQTQRGRLLAATVELASEHGIRGVTAARLADRANVSRTTLYNLFESKDDCLYSAAREALQELLDTVSEAATADRSAEARLEAMVDRFTEFCVEHPKAAQLGLVEIAGAGAEGNRLRNWAVDELTNTFRTPLAEAYPGAPTLTAEVFAGGLWHVAASRLREGHARELPVAGRVIRGRLLGALSGRQLARAASS